MTLRTLTELIQEPEITLLPQAWDLLAWVHQECLTYLVWNRMTHEALLIDPKRESKEVIQKTLAGLPSNEPVASVAALTVLAVIDTHTHADHISVAAEFAEDLKTPLIMHENAFSQKVHLRVCQDSQIITQAGPIKLIQTPGHTADGICILWGPFLFTGDTVLYGDVGRDDLPGGSAELHYNSICRLKEEIHSNTLVLPGHDNQRGRVSSWGYQLQTNDSLKQSRENFIRECASFRAPAPVQFKESLFENMS